MRKIITNETDLHILKDQYKSTKSLIAKADILKACLHNDNKDYLQLINYTYELSEPDETTDIKAIKSYMLKLSRKIFIY